MSNIVKPKIEDYADVEDYFAALDAYYETTLYARPVVLAA